MMLMLLCLALQCAGEYTVGSDSFYECVTGEEIDLTPVVEDEADSDVSKERN